MKLSAETIAILKNFSEINGNLLIEPGSSLKTISAQKGVMAEATLTETFDKQFGIYDLNEFLGAVSLFDDPELTFDDKWVTIKQGQSSVKFFAADPSILVHPSKAIKMPTPEIELDLTAAVLQMIGKTASVLRSSDVSLIGDGSSLVLQVGDKKNVTGNAYSAVLQETDKEFRANIRIDNLRMIPGDYKVSISSKSISRFVATAGKLTYYVALEQDSTFNV